MKICQTADSVHSAFGDKKADGIFDVEDLAMGFIRFDNGACMQIEFSWASNIGKEENFVELRGTKSGAKISSRGGLEIFSEEYGQLTDLIPKADDEKDIPQHEANLRHFLDVLGGAEPDFVPVQGVNMIKILEAMYKSAELGHEILL